MRKTNGAVDHLASAAANRQAVLDETSKSYALTGDPLMGLILWGPQDLPGVATALARAVPLGLQIKADELQADAHLALAASPEKLWK